MPRVKGGYVTRRRRKRVLKLAKGYFGSKHILYKTAQEQVMKSLAYAYRDRKQRKRDFRKLWITRINAACRMQNMSYSKFMHGMKIANVDVNRKMLADLAVNDINGFNQLVEIAKEAISNPEKFETTVEVKETKKAQPKKTKKAEPKKETKKAEPKKETKKVEPKKEEVKEEPKKAEPKKEEVKEEAKNEEKVPTSKKDLNKLTVKELREIAKDNDIAIPAGSRKADIVDLLSENL